MPIVICGRGEKPLYSRSDERWNRRETLGEG